jgi:hypothetical protein
MASSSSPGCAAHTARDRWSVPAPAPWWAGRFPPELGFVLSHGGWTSRPVGATPEGWETAP